MTTYTNQTLTCRDCGDEFTFTASEQEFFAEKGFDRPPTRCPACRRERKAARGRDDGGAAREPREMTSVICAQCGKEALIPFVPRGDRPVYCSECFEQQRAGGR